MALVVLALISGLAFLHYGIEILFRIRMKEEFSRYGMPRMRIFVGLVEMLGGVGVLMGLAFAPVGALAAAGLTLMMILGLIVRITINDALRLMVPAAVLCGVNGALVVLFLRS
jgi:uncharacterized membrane protein YphA (DoxX/SURF4 family)